MAQTWPNELPTVPLKDGYEEVTPESSIRTAMDAGPAKIRRRFTAGMRQFRVRYLLDRGQTDDLDEFYNATCLGGSDSFTWTNPRSGASETCRFLGPPRFTPGPGVYFYADIALEVMP